MAGAFDKRSDRPGGGGSGGFTPGAAQRVPYGNAGGNALTDHNDLRWDPVNKRLGPDASLAFVELSAGSGVRIYWGGQQVLVDGADVHLTAAAGGLVRANRIIAAAEGLAVPWRIVANTNYTILRADSYIQAQGFVATRTWTLPALSTVPDGKTYVIDGGPSLGGGVNLDIAVNAADAGGNINHNGGSPLSLTAAKRQVVLVAATAITAPSWSLWLVNP